MSDVASSGDSGRTAVRLNLVLFVVVAVAATLWFERHLKGYVTESLLLGGTLSLLGLWKLAWDMLARGGGPQGDDLLKRALASPHAREYLLFALVVVALLWTSTSSIYLSYSGGKDAAGAYVVEVWQCDRAADAAATTPRSCTTMLEPPIELKAYDRERGRPWFFRVATQHLEYRIASSPNFEPLALDWRAWSQHRLDVPGAFRPKDLHLVRLYPGFALAAQLPETATAPGARYRLEIVAGRDRVLVEPLTRGAVLTGMSAASLASAARGAAPLRDVVDAHYEQAGFAPTDRGALVATIVNDAAPHPSPDWRAGTALTIRVLRRGATAGEPDVTVLEKAYSIPAGQGHVHDVALAND